MILGVLTQLSAIFQLYHGDQLYSGGRSRVPGENNRPWVSTPFVIYKAGCKPMPYYHLIHWVTRALLFLN